MLRPILRFRILTILTMLLVSVLFNLGYAFAQATSAGTVLERLQTRRAL